MADKDRNSDIETLKKELKADPLQFFKKHPHESTVLEDKATFEYDLALELCTLAKKSGKSLLNESLALQILKTLSAFANSHGGMLVMGIAESKGRIVSGLQQNRCRQRNRKFPENRQPCYEALVEQDVQVVGDLILTGLNRELSITGWDVDKFQRHVVDRFSLGTGKSTKKWLKFNHALYPCDTISGRKKDLPWTRVSMSESIDQYIDELFSMTVSSVPNMECIIGAVTVKPSPRPIYLTIEESGSSTILYALPVRKTGKTELEKDLGRVQTYIASRFGTALADEITKRLLDILKERLGAAKDAVDEKDLPESVRQYALQWKFNGFPYRMVEDFGKQVKPFTRDLPLWEKEKSTEILAFLLLVFLHFNSGWEIWTLKNKSNPDAVSALFEVLHTDYWRTRFRALYALQFVDKRLLTAELKKPRHKKLSNRTQEVLKTNVKNQTVVSFIKEIAASELGSVSRKALEVLTEIAAQWKDPDAGMESPL